MARLRQFGGIFEILSMRRYLGQAKCSATKIEDLVDWSRQENFRWAPKSSKLSNSGMVDGIMLAEKTKEELTRIILDQDSRICELEERVEAEQKKRTEKFAKPNARKRRKKRPGQKPGHVGITREVPEHIDEIVNGTVAK